MSRRQSDESFARASKRLPGGVNSNVRLDAPRIFFERGKGAWLWDVDGNSYIDYLLGQGPAFLGHCPDVVLEAVHSATSRGMVFGAQHTLEIDAAESVCHALRWPDMVRFGSSGTEMVQLALRVARAATGRNRFVRFEGHYHGWLDDVLIAVDDGKPVPASSGQPLHHLDDCYLLPWNDIERVRELAARNSDDIAAIVMEPVMFNSGAILPRPGFLQEVRSLCDELGIVLIFDEIISGFRVALGGAAERFGVRPDLATYGKAMAGGWPVAALAGRADLMQAIGTGEVNHSGTFNGNVMASAAVVATLAFLREEGIHERLELTGEAVMDGLTGVALEASLPLRIQGLPMAFHASFGGDGEVWDHRGVEGLDGESYRRLAGLLVEEGVWVSGRGIWYVSAAHGPSEVDATLERARAALKRF